MSEYLNGFADGLKDASRELNEAARDHHEQSIGSKKVLEAQAHQLAASLLSSWANGMIIRADMALSKADKAEAPR